MVRRIQEVWELLTKTIAMLQPTSVIKSIFNNANDKEFFMKHKK